MLKKQHFLKANKNGWTSKTLSHRPGGVRFDTELVLTLIINIYDVNTSSFQELNFVSNSGQTSECWYACFSLLHLTHAPFKDLQRKTHSFDIALKHADTHAQKKYTHTKCTSAKWYNTVT